MESEGRSEVRPRSQGGNKTAAHITARMTRTKSVTLQACLWVSATVPPTALRAVDGRIGLSAGPGEEMTDVKASVPGRLAPLGPDGSTTGGRRDQTICQKSDWYF